MNEKVLLNKAVQAMKGVEKIIKDQYLESIGEGSFNFVQFFLPMDFHLILDQHFAVSTILLGHPNSSDLVERAVFQILRDVMASEPVVISTSAQIRVVLEWDTLPFSEVASSQQALPASHNELFPVRLVGIVTAISRPEMATYSSTFYCRLGCQSEDGRVVIRRDGPVPESMICLECFDELVEDEQGRGEHLAQRISLMVASNRMKCHEEVLLISSDACFLTPMDLGVKVSVTGKVYSEITCNDKGMRGYKVRRQLRATSLKRIARQTPKTMTTMHVLALDGTPKAKLKKIFGRNTTDCLFERLCFHLVVLTSMAQEACLEEGRDLDQRSKLSSSISKKKLSALFFGPIGAPVLNTLVRLEGEMLGSTPPVVATPSAPNLMPKLVTNREKSDWMRAEAGLIHFARDELLVLPYLETIPLKEQLQIANVIERGSVSTQSLLFPELECSLSVFSWCTVIEDSMFRRFARGEITLSKLLGSKLQPILLQNMDIVWFVDDRRAVEDILSIQNHSLVTDESLLWLRNVATDLSPRLSEFTSEILMTYYEMHRKLSAVSRRELVRVKIIAEKCANLLDSSIVEEFHCYLAACVCENTFRWKGIPTLVEEGIPTRNMADFKAFKRSLEECMIQFRSQE